MPILCHIWHTWHTANGCGEVLLRRLQIVPVCDADGVAEPLADDVCRMLL